MPETGRLSSSGALFVLEAFNNFIELIRQHQMMMMMIIRSKLIFEGNW